MKKILKAVAVMAALLTVSAAVSAQNPQGKTENSWREKMMAEKIGFLTAAMELTSEEAQAFWPVYNHLEEQKEQQMRASRNAYRALSAALKEGKSDDEIAEILAQYTSAQLASADLEAACISEYGKVLTPQKTARLIVGEEKFRRMQFQRFQGQAQGSGQIRGGEKGPRPADRPQQR